MAAASIREVAVHKGTPSLSGQSAPRILPATHHATTMTTSFFKWYRVGLRRIGWDC